MYRKTTALTKIRALKKRIKIIQGGTSSSKTVSILIILIDKCTRNPLLEVSVIAESVPHLKKGALKDFLKIMKATGRYIHANYNATDRKYTFGNGAYMEFFSPESVLGARRDILFINEAPNIRFTDYHQLAIRTKQEIYLDYNPSAEFWVQTELESDVDAEKIILTYKDNEALDPRIVREIEKARDRAGESEYWANWWKVYGLGLQGTVEGVIFGDFNPVPKFPEDCKWQVYGMDFGYTNDPTTFIKIGLFGGELYFEELLYAKGLTNPDISEGLETTDVKKQEIIADSAEPKSIKELKDFGWRVQGAAKGKDSIVNGIDAILRYKCNIVNTSLNLIKEWRTYSYKFDVKLNKYINVPEDTNNHCIDAIRYGVSFKVKPKAKGPRGRVLRSNQ